MLRRAHFACGVVLTESGFVVVASRRAPGADGLDGIVPLLPRLAGVFEGCEGLEAIVLERGGRRDRIYLLPELGERVYLVLSAEGEQPDLGVARAFRARLFQHMKRMNG
jgi:hypothetical protein